MIWEKLVQRLIKPEPWPEQAFRLPQFQSHRGFHARGLRENSLDAFLESAKQGFQMVECDVRLSADRVPVILHDSDLVRVYQNSSEVHKLESGTLWDQFQIPTLKQLLTDSDRPEFVNIELKTKIASDPLIRKVAEVVVDLRAQDRVLLSSFNPFALWLLQDYLPHTPRALLVSDEATVENKWWLRKMATLPLLKVHMLNLQESMLSPKNLQFWKVLQMPISAWTIKDARRGAELLDHGVQSLITDLALDEF